MKVYLDDVRDAPSGWMLVRKPDELFEMLCSGQVSILSLDNDLGEFGIGKGFQPIEGSLAHYFDTAKMRNVEGYMIADWLLWYCSINHAFVPPTVVPHTSNPSRYHYILETAEKLSSLRRCFICKKNINKLTKVGGTTTTMGPNNQLVRVCKSHKGVIDEQ